jgi:hypothetical protein
MIIGVDYRPSFQAIAFFVEGTDECGERHDPQPSVRPPAFWPPQRLVDHHAGPMTLQEF